jgi:hypothetical protein
MSNVFFVACPFCGEDVELIVEPDERGPFVQDCDVCCRPWTVRVSTAGGERYVTLSRADGSE